MPDTVISFPVEDIDQRWPTLDFQQRAFVVDQLIRLGDFERARSLLSKLTAASPSQGTDLRFLDGALLKAEGKLPEAIAVFRGILAIEPAATRARIELAQALFTLQEDESARHHFELLLGGAGTGSPGQMADQIAQSYINAIDGRRRWDMTSYATLAPSTNLNLGAANARIGSFAGLEGRLSERNVAKSGVGVAGGVQAGYRHPLTDTIDLAVSAGVNGKRFQDQRFDSLVATVSAGPRARFEWGYLGLYGLADKRWLGDEDYATSWGGQLSSAVRLLPGSIVFSDAVCSKRRFSTEWDHTNLSFQDGHVCSLNVRIEHHLTSSSYLNLIGRVGREQTQSSALDNVSRAVGAGVYQELPFGLSVYGQALYTRTQFDDIYPTMSYARADARWELSAQFTKRDWQILGLAPSLQYVYATNASNVHFLSYDAHGVNLTLTKKY